MATSRVVMGASVINIQSDYQKYKIHCFLLTYSKIYIDILSLHIYLNKKTMCV